MTFFRRWTLPGAAGEHKALTGRIETLADYPRLTAAMQRRGWNERRIRAVLGENWLRFLGDALTPEAQR